MNLFVLRSQSKKPIDALSLQKKSNASAATVKSLVDKGILEEHFTQNGRIEFSGAVATGIKSLNEAQQQAYHEINSAFNEHSVVLFHGVTSGRKPEISARLIE